MVNKRSWDEFRSTGLIWFVNTILHMFGWALVISVGDCGEVVEAYPARVKFRGFSETINTAGYQMVTDFLANHIEDLQQEANS